MDVSFSEFQKLDLRVGKIIEAERVENSQKLVKLQVDFGTEKKQAVAGIAEHYKPEELVGGKYMFICNLEHRRLMGIESECMIFAADDGKGSIVLMRPERDVEVGSKIK